MRAFEGGPVDESPSADAEPPPTENRVIPLQGKPTLEIAIDTLEGGYVECPWSQSTSSQSNRLEGCDAARVLIEP